jgi:DNA-binding SARP family transcriptional activator
LLGGFRVSVGSRTITKDAWRLRKAAALVKLLALAPGHRMHREQAMDLLWPGSTRRAASANLRQTLHAARRALDPDEGSRYLVSEGEQLVLCPQGQLWVDVEAFEQAATSARRSGGPAAYRAAIELPCANPVCRCPSLVSSARTVTSVGLVLSKRRLPIVGALA